VRVGRVFTESGRKWKAASTRGFTLLFIAILLPCRPAPGLVLHTDDQPATRPPDAVIGRWAYNASCVVINPNLVLTTRHQGGHVGSTVEIAGQSYVVSETFDHYMADLRIARITKPEGQPVILDEWAFVYAGRSDFKRSAVFGGYGRGRGTTLYTDAGVPYAYTWSGGLNTTLRWGVNYVDVPVWEIQASGYRSKGLRADFDDFDVGGYVPHEAAPAAGDSGGGWFVYENDRWELIGLNAIAEHSNETWFRDPSTGSPNPDYVYAVRVRSYADWIAITIRDNLLIGDADGNGIVNGCDYCVWSDHLGETGLPSFLEGGWAMGNFNSDDIVNGGDYTLWADHYGWTAAGPGPKSAVTSRRAAGGRPVPAPTMLLLMAPAGVALLKRRARTCFPTAGRH